MSWGYPWLLPAPAVVPAKQVESKLISELYNQHCIYIFLPFAVGAAVTTVYTVPLEKELFIDAIYFKNLNFEAGVDHHAYLDIYDANGTFSERVLHAWMQGPVAPAGTEDTIIITYPLTLYVDQGRSIRMERDNFLLQDIMVNIHGWLGPKR